MIEQYLRPSYQRILVNPFLHLVKNIVTPNQLTLLSGFLGILVLPALLWHHQYIAVALLLLSGICDTLDGSLARFQQNCSNMGSVLDIVTDRLVEIIVVIALFMVSPEHRGMLCLLMLGSMLLCITSFLVVGIFTANDSQKSFYYSPGLIERAEAFLFFITMMLWPQGFVFLAIMFVILVIYTAVSRLLQFYCLSNK